jgi:hypothetical protein
MPPIRSNRIKLLLALGLCLVGLASIVQHVIVNYHIDRQVQTLNTIIQQLGPGFENVRAVRSTQPAAWLNGRVASAQDRARLLQAVRLQFGDAQAHRLLLPIQIDKPSTTQSINDH